MSVSEADLQAAFGPKETSELLRLHGQDLTDLAIKVIEAELARRGVPTPERKPLPQLSPRPEGSFFKGEQPLQKTFVLLGVVGAFVVQAIGFGVASGVNNILGRPWGGFAMLLIIPPYVVFASVSIWRSASRSKSLAGATVAKLLMIPWVLTYITVVYMGVFEGLKTLSKSTGH